MLFLLYGTGANGKSTFLDALQAMLADYAQQADFTTQPKFARNGAADAALTLHWLAAQLARMRTSAASPRMRTGSAYCFARVRREVGLQGRQRGAAIIWRRILVLKQLTPTDENAQTLPSQVGAMLGSFL